MRCLALAGMVAMLGSSAAAIAGGAGERIYRVEPELTSAEFAVGHLGLSQHGHFARGRGTIVLDTDSGSGSIELLIDATSVDTGWPARDEFLKGADMFDAERFPVIAFRSTQLAFEGSRISAVAGELTMHGATRPILLKVGRLDCGKTPDEREGCNADVAATIKRSDFGMNYALGLVGDEIALSFQLTAFRIATDGVAVEKR